jgi:hypothetical protein
MVNDPRAQGLRHRDRVIRRSAVHYHDIVGKRFYGAQNVADTIAFIPGDNAAA